MSKDESKKEKKSKRKSSSAADDSIQVDTPNVTVDADDVSVQVKKKEKKEKKDKKEKKEKKSDDVEMKDGETTQQEDAVEKGEIPPEAISPIAHPLAQKKLSKKVYKTIKKASKSRGHVKRGVKEVVKCLRKGEKGLVILAGDISPMDILSHIPLLCEETDNPYIFVTSKDSLGAASSTKRPTSCVMIVPGGGKKAAAAKLKNPTKEEVKGEDYKEDYEALHEEVKGLDEKVVFA